MYGKMQKSGLPESFLSYLGQYPGFSHLETPHGLLCGRAAVVHPGSLRAHRWAAVL